MECEKCGFPMTEIIGVYREEPKRGERKVCLNCLRKKVEELGSRVNDLMNRKPKIASEGKD